jgi:hypothetical protein
MTSDGAQNGCMRNYAVTNGSDFVVAPIGCKGRAEFEARFNMSLEVYNPLTGDVQQRLDLSAGQRFELSGDTAWVLKGQTK